MDVAIYGIVSVFLLVIGGYFGFRLGQDRSKEITGQLNIYTQDDDAYLFLDIDMSLLELANYKEVTLTVVNHGTQN